MFLEVVHLFWSLSCTFSFSLFPFSFLLSFFFFCLSYSFKLSSERQKLLFVILDAYWRQLIYIILLTSIPSFLSFWRRHVLPFILHCGEGVHCFVFRYFLLADAIGFVLVFARRRFKMCLAPLSTHRRKRDFFFFEKIHLAIVMY